ncbi:MAG: ParB N-terminal domain-containing protein [Coprobacillus sp.]|nr:ParB N-terminal domain-containing protein [Coprobacillus sp.]
MLFEDIGLEADEHMEQIIDLSHRKNITMIPLTQLMPNKLNPVFDTKEDIERFSEEIYEQGGVRDPLHVYEDNLNNKYVILGGHKRYYACQQNRKKYADAQSIIPVIIEPAPSNEAEEIIMIEELNQHRNYTDEQLLERTRRLYFAYEELVKIHKKPKGQKRDWFAKKLNVGSKKAERFIHIIEGKYSAEETKLKNRSRCKNPLNKNYEDVRIHLQRKLHTKVKITDKTIIFSFTGIDDFNRLLEMIGCENVVNE